jgi:hypothetical protein
MQPFPQVRKDVFSRDGERLPDTWIVTCKSNSSPEVSVEEQRLRNPLDIQAVAVEYMRRPNRSPAAAHPEESATKLAKA